MKFLAASSIALLGVDASFKAMTNAYKELLAGDRNLLLTSVANIDQYGCWCYFDSAVGNGKGEPMDLIDAECRNLHRGYECAVADYANCEPWAITYFPVSGTNFITDHGSIAAACIHTNTVLTNFGDCAAAACAVETEYISEYTAITQNYNPQFSVYSHVASGRGSFVPTNNCVTNAAGTHDESPRQCCGSFPQRYPFKVYAGTPDEAACCDGSVYKIASHSCCNGVVQTLGSPCL